MPSNDKPTPPTKRSGATRLPTREELLARGFKEVPPSGNGFIMPTGRRPTSPPATGDASE